MMRRLLAFFRSPVPTDTQDLALVQARVQRLEIAQRELQETVVQLIGHHNKLRNQFHGEKGGRPSQSRAASLDDIPRGDKAALRKALGVVPGRPYEHHN